jgi:Uma2 family endonuclease
MDAIGNWLLSVIERGISMVVEVTSSSLDHDRNGKRGGYAAAKIPLYLLVDRQEGQVTLFSDPVRNDYATQAQAPFGGSIKLPPPVLLHPGNRRLRGVT